MVYEILCGFKAFRARYGELRCSFLALYGVEDACVDKIVSECFVCEVLSVVK